MESVRDVELFTEFAIGCQHRRKNIGKFDISNALNVVSSEAVVFADLSEVLLTGWTGFE